MPVNNAEIQALDRRDVWSRRLTGRPALALDPQRLCFGSTKGRARSRAEWFRGRPGLAVILAFGQSQLANEGEAAGRYNPSRDVHNFNLFDGRCYRARDPLLGPTFDRANLLTRLGDLLIERGRFERVLLVPIAYGGTSVAEWKPGGRMYPRLAIASVRLRRLGVEPTHALWHLGETDAARGLDADAWRRDFAEMVAGLRALGVNAPLFVAQSTICCSPRNEVVRAAQRSVIDPAQAIFPGPDTDALGSEHRWDDCHFSTSGLRRAAELWLEALTAPR